VPFLKGPFSQCGGSHTIQAISGVWFQNIRWRDTGPEDRKGCVKRKECIKRKEINRNSILSSHLLTPGWLTTNVNSADAVYNQKPSKFFVSHCE
jgi:hypothetical protein